MYKNTTSYRRILYRYGMFTIIFFCIVLICSLAFIIYKWVKRKQTLERTATKKDQYLQLIAEYYADSATRTDSWITAYKEAYQPEDDQLWSDFPWTNNTEQFHSILDILDAFVQATNTKNSIYYKSQELWGIVREALSIIRKKIKFPPTNFTVPFGTNWYQFSITLPRLLTAAMFLYEAQFGKQDEELLNFMQRYVLAYLPNPVKSMGWARDGPNVVMMSVPYFGAHLLLGDFEDTLDLSEVKTVLNTANFKIVTHGEGLYPDGGFWFHKTLRAYGYITSSFKDYVLVNKLFEYTSFYQFYKAFEKTEHPTIECHFGPWFGRALSIKSSQNALGKLGFYRIDSIAGVSCKTSRWILSFNGQHPELCAYESDQANFVMAQFWVFARMLMYSDTETTIQTALITRYPGVVSFDNKLVELRSTTTTTDQFFPTEAATYICQLDNILAFYTEFQFAELNIKTWELIVVDEQTDGYYCLQHLAPIRAASNSQLYKSVNLGMSGVRYNESTGVVYKFPHDYTHILRGQPELETAVVGDNGVTTYTSLQLLPDNEDYVCYVTCGKPHHNMRAHDPENRRIDLFESSVHFDATRKWLVLKRGKSVAIGQSIYPMPKTINLQQNDTNAVLGLNAQPVNGILTTIPTKTYKFNVNHASLMCEFKLV